jgi:hypothetical protein
MNGKTIRLFVITASLMLVAIPNLTAAAAPLADYDIAFDNHCDGMHLTIPRFSDIRYTVIGDRTGCSSGRLYGVARPDTNGKYGVARGNEFVADETGTPLTVIRNDHTWTTYELVEDGTTIYVLDSGTWSRGTPGVRGSASTTAANARNRSPIGQYAGAATIHIRMDGFDDQDLWLNNPSAGLGTENTIDGSTYCCNNKGWAGLIGVKARIANQADTFIVAYHMRWFESGWIAMVVFFPDYTWIEFDLAGVVGSGTWHIRG